MKHSQKELQVKIPYNPMEVIVKARLLLTSALLMFVQIPAQAQVAVKYCYGHGDTTVMDAVKDMGLGK